MTDKTEQDRLKKIADLVKEREHLATKLAEAERSLAYAQPRMERYENDVQIGRIAALKSRITSLVPGTPFRRRRLALLERKPRHRVANGGKFASLTADAREDVDTTRERISNISMTIETLSAPAA